MYRPGSQLAQTDSLLGAGGKPSTWFPPGGCRANARTAAQEQNTHEKPACASGLASVPGPASASGPEFAFKSWAPCPCMRLKRSCVQARVRVKLRSRLLPSPAVSCRLLPSPAVSRRLPPSPAVSLNFGSSGVRTHDLPHPKRESYH